MHFKSLFGSNFVFPETVQHKKKLVLKITINQSLIFLNTPILIEE